MKRNKIKIKQDEKAQQWWNTKAIEKKKKDLEATIEQKESSCILKFLKF